MKIPTICHVLHSLQIGGAEMLAKQIAAKMTGEYRSVFACLDFQGELGDRLKEDGNTVAVVGRKPGFDIGCATRIAGFCQDNDVQLIHAHQYAPFFYSSIARFFGRKTPILFTEHGRDHPDYPRQKRILANRFLLHKRDAVVAVSECIRHALMANEGIPSSRIEVIRNGVELSRYDPKRPLRHSVRQELGVDDDQILFMHVARLNRLKDHPTAIRAVAEAIKHDKRIRLALVGDGESRSGIEELVAELGLGNIVQILGERSDVARLLQGADMFMLSSITEGIPLTLIEAMATGLPCLSTDVGGVGEVIVDRRYGELVEPSSPVSLAERMVTLICDERRREEMGLAALARVREAFDAGLMFSQYESIYRNLSASA